MKNKCYLILALGCVVFGVSCKHQEHPVSVSDFKHEDVGEIVLTKEQAVQAHLKTEVVKLEKFVAGIKVSGKLRSRQGDEQMVVAKSDGIMNFSNRFLSEGQEIKRGNLIGEIQTGGLQNGDPWKETRIAYEAARTEYLRAQKLIEDKLISRKEFEQIRAAYERSKSVYEGQIRQRTGSGLSVTAPKGGYVKSRLVNQGGYVSVGTPIMIISSNRRMQLKADVPERYFKELRNIVSANFRPDYDEAVYKLSDLHGKVLSYGKSSEDDSPYIPIIFEFDNIGDFVPGSFVEVYLLAAPQSGVISVPISALVEEQGIWSVYLRRDSEHYEKREVKLGRSNGVRMEVISGLHPGDEIVVSGTSQVRLAASSSSVPESHHQH